MKPGATLLLTIDKSLEEIVADVLVECDHEMHIAHGVDDALDLVCRSPTRIRNTSALAYANGATAGIHKLVLRSQPSDAVHEVFSKASTEPAVA